MGYQGFMALHVIEIEPGVEVAADIEICGSPDPRSGLFNYTDSVQALPEAVRSALLGGAIAGQHEARDRGIIDGIDEVNINSITLRGELAPNSMHAAMHAAMYAAVLCAAGARSRVARDGAKWTVVSDAP